MKNLSQKEFIERCVKIHGDRYDYSNTIYVNKRNKVIVICKIHGKFIVNPAVHLRGSNCPLCVNKNVKYTDSVFIEKAKKIHNNLYNYSEVKYINNHTKVKIICEKHGEFYQSPNTHLSGKGCPSCGGTRKKKDSELIEKANIVHNGKYDYSLMKYINNRIKIKIICPEHGVFEQKPINHITQKQGCPKCGGTKKLNNDEFIKRANKIHNNKYDYILTEYKSNAKKIDIICKKHGVFKQTPNSHLNGRGCPICNESKGEKMIRNFLIENKIKFKSQKKFKNCRYKRILHFDFYLYQYKTCIEFDGIYHEKKMNFVTDKLYEDSKIRDEIKNNFCINNNLKLIRIDVENFKKIKDILKKELNINE